MKANDGKDPGPRVTKATDADKENAQYDPCDLNENDLQRLFREGREPPQPFVPASAGSKKRVPNPLYGRQQTMQAPATSMFGGGLGPSLLQPREQSATSTKQGHGLDAYASAQGSSAASKGMSDA